MQHDLSCGTFLTGTGLAAIASAAPLSAQARADGTLRVTRIGAVRGEAADDIFIFKGVPFAEPPIGALRFLPPQPKMPWQGEWEAKNFRSNALQAPFNLTGVALPNALNGSISEDCLYLNIWTPASPGPHPVLVWIYGGGNIQGGPSQPIYDGAYFARDGVVCVTLGYRLGAHGFLTLDRLLGPQYAANNALRDLLMGLTWVRDNIAEFGGDPGRVTIGGESAGGKNVGSLLCLPQSAGLFSQAIIESGGAQTVYDRDVAEAVSTMFLDAADISLAHARHILDLTPEKIIETEINVLKHWSGSFPFRPVIDGDLMLQSPIQGVHEGKARGLRILVGTNADESRAFVSKTKAEGPISQKELSNASIEKVLSVLPGYERALPQLTSVERRLRIITAEEYWIPNLRIAEAQSAANGEVYMYMFDYRTQNGARPGLALHTSELPFVWENFSDPMIESFVGGGEFGLQPGGSILPFYDDRAKDVARTIHAAWVSFIKGAAPQADGLPQWSPYDLNQRHVMILNSSPIVERDPRGEERELWNGIL